MLRLEQQSGRRIFVASRPQSTLVRLREMLATPEDLRRKIEAMATRYDARFPSVFETIQQMLEKPIATKKAIGFHLKSDAWENVSRPPFPRASSRK